MFLPVPAYPVVPDQRPLNGRCCCCCCFVLDHFVVENIYTKCVFVCLQQLAALLITRQVIGNLKEAVLPYIIEKVKLMWIGVRIAESMSPDSLQHEMKQFADQSADSAAKKTDRPVDDDEEEAEQHVETRKVGSEEIEIVHSGLHLTQAEVEAAMKKVGSLSLRLLDFECFCS